MSKMIRSLSAGLTCVLLVVSAIGRADESASPWPQWRGPNRDNISRETGLLKQWPADGPPLAWKAHGLGAGYSDVAVANGRIYTMGDAQDACYVMELSLDGQKILWRTKVGQPGGGGGYAGPRCTPTISGNTLVCLGQFGDLLCLDAGTGQERWHKNMENDFHGHMMSGWGYAESPIIDHDRVICTPGGQDGTVVALDINSGNTLWRSKDLKDSACYASPIEASIGGREQYVVLTGESVAGVAAENGQLLWRAPRQGQTAVIPTPLVKENEVFVTSGYGVGCNLFKITQDSGKFSATEVYANKHMMVHHGGVILLNDYIYGSSEPGILTCMEFETGKVKWKDRSIGKGSLTYADGHLYLRAESGTVALIDATPDGYHLVSQFNQPDRSSENAWPHPVVAGGKLYLRDQDLLLCYDVKQK